MAEQATGGTWSDRKPEQLIGQEVQFAGWQHTPAINETARGLLVPHKTTGKVIDSQGPYAGVKWALNGHDLRTWMLPGELEPVGAAAPAEPGTAAAAEAMTIERVLAMKIARGNGYAAALRELNDEDLWELRKREKRETAESRIREEMQRRIRERKDKRKEMSP